MLDMLSDHMEEIYNEHAGEDTHDMLNNALRTYNDAINQLHHPANIPDIDHHDVFNLFQKKSECKAGGFDGWKTKELQALPPCGWVGFTFVVRVAEAYGVWPKVLRMVAVTARSKGAPISSPPKCASNWGLFCRLWNLEFIAVPTTCHMDDPSFSSQLVGRNSE